MKITHKQLRQIIKEELSKAAPFGSGMNQAKLNKTLDELPSGSHVILDATATHHLDPCIETLLIGFMTTTVPEHDLKVSLTGFQDLVSSGGREHFPEQISQADPDNGDAS